MIRDAAQPAPAAESPESPERAVRPARRLPLLASAFAASVLLVAVWLADVSGLVDLTSAPLPGRLCQAAAGLAALAWAAWSARWLALRAAEARRQRSFWPWALPVAIVLSLVVHLVGIEWEVGTGFYRDEGIYEAAAAEINGGSLFPPSFIYGHLPYYVLALAAWLYERFPDVSGVLYAFLYDRHTAHDHLWLTLRAVSALFGAFTVVPVFLAAERVAGRLAAVLAAVLVVFSTLYNEITHLVISDVPSAFFAALVLPFAARLAVDERPRRRDFVWGGIAAGLAAASKYPAGVVAVALVALWARELVRVRRFTWSLLWSGLAAIGTFLAAMPAFLVHADKAFAGEGKDLLFGFRQYGRGGWIGVVRESDALFYAERLWASFGPPAVVLGLVGLLLVPRGSRARVAWLLPYPVAYLLLLDSMSMSVRRNLLPVLPWLALLLGIGVAAIARRILPVPGRTRVRQVAVALLLAAALFVPVRATIEQDLRYSRASTSQAAIAWMRDHLPPGARVVKESYTPKLDALPFAVLQSRFAARRSLEEIRDPANDFLLLSWNAYGRFLREDRVRKPHHLLYAERYREMLSWEKVRDFAPGRTRLGPFLSLYRVAPEVPELRSERVFEAGDAAFVWPPRTGGSPAEPLVVPPEGWLLFKDYFDAGRYALRVAFANAEAGGRFEIRGADGEPVAAGELAGGGAAVELPRPDKYFVYLYPQPGAALSRLELSRSVSGDAADAR